MASPRKRIPFHFLLDGLESSTKKFFAGYVIVALSIPLGIWFWHNNHRIGPEWIEPIVLLVGWAFLLALSGCGFMILVRGIKEI